MNGMFANLFYTIANEDANYAKKDFSNSFN